MDAIFTDPSEFQVNQDLKLYHKALRGGWLTVEKRNELQQRLFTLAMANATIETTKEFCQLVTIMEKMFQFDVKLALAAAKLESGKTVSDAEPSLESRKAALAARIKAMKPSDN